MTVQKAKNCLGQEGANVPGIEVVGVYPRPKLYFLVVNWVGEGWNPYQVCIAVCVPAGEIYPLYSSW